MAEESKDVEVLIAIGRIEEGMRFVRESINRIERKVDTNDEELKAVKLDVNELKTQRNSSKNTLAVALSIVAILVSVVKSFLFP
jgi:septal ring factor EnvC (AmiA/AmiB activator)